jgi:hypothetical protein
MIIAVPIGKNPLHSPPNHTSHISVECRGGGGVEGETIGVEFNAVIICHKNHHLTPSLKMWRRGWLYSPLQSPSIVAPPINRVLCDGDSLNKNKPQKLTVQEQVTRKDTLT